MNKNDVRNIGIYSEGDVIDLYVSSLLPRPLVLPRSGSGIKFLFAVSNRDSEDRKHKAPQLPAFESKYSTEGSKFQAQWLICF